MPAARRGTLLVAAAAACWSTGGLIARLVAADAWTTNFWRCLFCAAFLLVVLGLVRRLPLAEQVRRIGLPGLGVALFMSIASTCFILSLSRTSVANTLVLMSVGPYVAGLLGWVLLGERVGLRTWATMAVALIGTVVMVSGSWGTGALTGDLLALVMAGAFATATVLVRRHPDVQMAPAALLATTATFLVALPLASPLATSGRDIGLLALFGIGQFGVGFLLFTAGARLIPAAQTSLIGLLETVLGPLWVWLLLAEQPGPATLLGGSLILGGLLVHTALDLPGRAGGEVALPAAAPDASGPLRS